MSTKAGNEDARLSLDSGELGGFNEDLETPLDRPLQEQIQES